MRTHLCRRDSATALCGHPVTVEVSTDVAAVLGTCRKCRRIERTLHRKVYIELIIQRHVDLMAEESA